MKEIRFIHDFREIDAAAYRSGYQPASMKDWSTHDADLHIQLADKDVVAHASLWWKQVPPFPGQRLGVIGHFGATEDARADLLLETCCTQLSKQGCTLAVGPMDGNTWRRYRFVTDFGSEPSFFMEPWNPACWPRFFEASKFATLSNYGSALVTDLYREDERVSRVEERLQNQGVTIRMLQLGDFEGDLRRIHKISVASFRKNYLYTDLAETDFLALYVPFRDRIRPELILIAEHNGDPVGFIFGIPDYAQAQRGQKIETAIAKTLAVLPGKIYGGLGLVLTQRLHRQARELGFSRLIHALQHENNQVRNMTQFYGSMMRQYTLYSRPL